MTSHKIKVLLVDDSAVVRQALTRVLGSAPDIEVCGSVIDPIFAMQRMKQQWPDVIVLDVEMPRMDGITFLKKIMEERPTPVVICSTLTLKGSETTMQALSSGAVDIINKPTIGVKGFLQESADLFIDTVRGAARANLKTIKRNADLKLKVPPKLTADAMLAPGGPTSLAESTDKVVAIGTSTGGTQALELVLPALPRVIPGIVVVQHMPEKFTQSFAQRLNAISQLDIKEACDNDRVIPGRALIAPGGKHMLLERSGAHYYVRIKDGPLVSRHRPSVDVLFRSVAKAAGKNALGIIMTGMGDDGARGLREMFDVDARTLAQDEVTSVVYGMPKEAVNHGGVQEVLALQDIPQAIVQSFTQAGSNEPVPARTRAR
ncbi:Chemotaxis response regulator protein-glutamate methylesterase CheB [hydrothermal vent metagenome]|uniref:protein-glutamate methylesterase n=1 Tax=hydrothermal vent metagenome TaxID=652676 RepID=A0A3B0YVU6_9ZZZZ